MQKTKTKKIRILNKSKDVSIFEKFEICNDFQSRMRGLMFRKKATNLFFEFEQIAKNPIHSFFVPFEFDAIYLSKDYEVVDFFSKVKPFSAYIEPGLENSYLIEAPVGFCKKMRIEIGDKLNIEYESE